LLGEIRIKLSWLRAQPTTFINLSLASGNYLGNSVVWRNVQNIKYRYDPLNELAETPVDMLLIHTHI